MQFYRTLVVALIVAGLGWEGATAATCQPRRPTPSLQSQAQFFGSQDYYDAHGGNNTDYVAALYADVLGRQPTENEVQHWLSCFKDCSNGITMAREFLIFAQSELAARAAAAPEPIRTNCQSPYLVSSPIACYTGVPRDIPTIDKE
jgi:hypothetical protein